jgi:hypothetical protein
MCLEPPGPVDNSKICQVKSGIPTLLANSDYAQISGDMWTMLKDTYGGGPEVLFRPAAISVSSSGTVIRLDDGNEAATVSGKPEITAEK